jgi:hypothetical protein
MMNECAGTFAGFGEEQGGGAVACRYVGSPYLLEMALDGPVVCFADGEAADCAEAGEGTFDLVGELLIDDTTYAVTGEAWAFANDEESVQLDCNYRVLDPNPEELPALEESGGKMGLGITALQWRHNDADSYPDWEYCRLVMEEHSPPG